MNYEVWSHYKDIETISTIEPLETISIIEPVETISTVDPLETISTIEPLETITKDQPSSVVDGIDYSEFVEAINQRNWAAMREFLSSHPGANAAVMFGGQTALHFILRCGEVETGELLSDEMRDEDLQILDSDDYTAFARLTNYNQPGVIELLQRMLERNAHLPNVGYAHSVPVVIASWKGFKQMTHYLYSVTDEKILNPEYDSIGVHLLINCINIGLFDIAVEIVTKFPSILQQNSNLGEYPIHALAKAFSANKCGSRHKKSISKLMQRMWKSTSHEMWDDQKLVYDQARDFLQLVCAQVSSYNVLALKTYVYPAMIEASRNGVIEFVSEMLVANFNLIGAHVDDKTIFWHAIENRQVKVYGLIYSFIGQKDTLLSCSNPEKNNILHLVAKLPPSAALDRTSGPALQMQRESQWFQEVWSLAKPRYREDLNNNNLTPRALFTETHKNLIDAGEKAMKDTAQSSTVVGALIFTIMFAAAFAVPGGNNQETGFPIFSNKSMFRVFIICDALSLFSSITSVLVFLGILTSRYAENDFFLRLPSKLMIGLVAFFFSIITMMVSFCSALALMLDGEVRYMLPIVLLAFVPIVIFMSSIAPVLSEMFMSTFGPSMFDKTGEFLEKKVMVKSSRVGVSTVRDQEKKVMVNKVDVNIGHEVEELELFHRCTHRGSDPTEA